jgi:beta-galactosidase/beta-glucuronidase
MSSESSCGKTSCLVAVWYVFSAFSAFLAWIPLTGEVPLNASIKVEAEQAVVRLRSHPSVVILAGNNEDYQVAEALGVMDYNDNSGEYMHTKFPA